MSEPSGSSGPGLGQRFTHDSRATRGHGLLEPLLARLRAQRANSLIPQHLRQGRILDVGCGSFPYLLAHTSFTEKFGIDQRPASVALPNICWHAMDLNAAPRLPFDDGFFSVITMLALVEHLHPSSLVALFEEAHRVLQPGGLIILTTPTAWTNGLLHWLARLALVSAEEINEHVYAYTLPLLGWYFGRGGFAMERVRFGYFEFMLNMWATAEK